MRILHCISTLATGGAERQLSLLAPQQARLGDNVHVAFLAEGPNLRPLIPSSVETHRINATSYRDPKLLFDLNRVMRQVRPDIVHTWLLQMDIAAGGVSLVRRIPWVMSERSCSAAYEPVSVKGRLRLRMGRLANGVIANSEDGRNMWAGRLQARSAVYFVPNALAVDEILAQAPTSRDLLNVEQGRPIILIAGRLAPEKNLLFLVEVAARVCTASSAVFVVCGEGPLESEIRRAIADRRLAGEFRLLGNRNDIWGIMKTADLFVNASLFEGQPNAVLEALVCGCPLVLSDIPAHRRLVAPAYARFASLRSSTEFASAILDVLGSSTKAGISAEAAIDTGIHTPEAVAVMHRAIYEDLLSKL